jgi:hypothetical protein
VFEPTLKVNRVVSINHSLCVFLRSFAAIHLPFKHQNPARRGCGTANNSQKFTAKTPRKLRFSRPNIHLGELGALAVNPQVSREDY